MSKPKLRTIAFIDAANIIYGGVEYGWRMDFEKLIRYLKDRFGTEVVYYYAGLDAENKKQLGFYEKLQEYGYQLRLVPVKKFSDGKKKADVDSRMTFEMMKYLKSFDRAIVLTGDGDYYWLFEHLLEGKKEIVLLAFAKSTARELKQLFGGRFTDLSRLKRNLEYKVKKIRQTP